MSAPERWARVVAYFVAVAGVFAFAEVAGNVWCVWLTRPGSRARVHRSNWLVRMWGSSLCELTLRILKCELIVRGQVPPGRYIVASNHQSTADISILIHVLRTLNCKYVAKRMLSWGMPAVSVAIARAGGAFISRTPTRRDLEGLRRMGAELSRWDGSAVIFAEGSRSRDGRVRPYRAGALRIVATESRLPILPVAIDGTSPATDLPGFARRMPGLRACVTIGEPVPFAAWDGRLDEALDEIRKWAIETIEAGRLAGSVEPPAGWSPGKTAGVD